MPLRRRSTSDSPTPTPDASETSDETLTRLKGDEGKKGRPTPSRKTSEAANLRPIVVADRRAANREARAKIRAERQTQYQAQRTNNTSKLPPRDQGPVRAYIRDYVDARWNIGEFFLFAAFALLILSMLFSNMKGSAAAIGLVFMGAIYLIVILAIVDGFILWRQLKRRLTAKFGDDKIERGMLMYSITRAFQIRRARLPKVRHKKHGNYPD